MDKKKAHLTKLIIQAVSSILIIFLIFLIIGNILFLISNRWIGVQLFIYYGFIIIVIIIIDIISIKYLNRHYLKQDNIPEKILEIQKKELEKKGFCKSCGAEILDKTGDFCSKCGSPLK